MRLERHAVVTELSTGDPPDRSQPAPGSQRFAKALIHSSTIRTISTALAAAITVGSGLVKSVAKMRARSTCLCPGSSHVRTTTTPILLTGETETTVAG